MPTRDNLNYVLPNLDHPVMKGVPGMQQKLMLNHDDLVCFC